MKDQIEFLEFLEIEKKLEIKIGKIISMEEVPKSSKLLKLEVDFGDEKRTVVTNIKPHLKYPWNNLEGLTFAFVTNLKPTTIMGIESNAMIMPGQIDKGDQILMIKGNPGGILL